MHKASITFPKYAYGCFERGFYENNHSYWKKYCPDDGSL